MTEVIQTLWLPFILLCAGTIALVGGVRLADRVAIGFQVSRLYIRILDRRALEPGRETRLSNDKLLWCLVLVSAIVSLSSVYLRLSTSVARPISSSVLLYVCWTLFHRNTSLLFSAPYLSVAFLWILDTSAISIGAMLPFASTLPTVDAQTGTIGLLVMAFICVPILVAAYNIIRTRKLLSDPPLSESFEWSESGSNENLGELAWHRSLIVGFLVCLSLSIILFLLSQAVHKFGIFSTTAGVLIASSCLLASVFAVAIFVAPFGAGKPRAIYRKRLKRLKRVFTTDFAKPKPSERPVPSATSKGDGLLSGVLAFGLMPVLAICSLISNVNAQTILFCLGSCLSGSVGFLGQVEQSVDTDDATSTARSPSVRSIADLGLIIAFSVVALLTASYIWSITYANDEPFVLVARIVTLVNVVATLVFKRQLSRLC